MSMMSPQLYANKFQNAPMQEIINERRKLIQALCQYEDDYILGNKKERVIVEPSPSARYSVHNEYLIAITELIETRRQQEYIDSLKK